MIMYATEIKEYIDKSISEYIKDTNKQLSLLIINASDDLASERYINTKKKACTNVGIKCDIKHFNNTCTQEDIIEYIEENQDNYTSVMIQEPIYKHLNHDILMRHIHPLKDVDGLHPLNQGMLYDRINCGIRPCTALGVMFILDHYDIDVNEKLVSIIGRGKLVADPLAKMLEQCGATVAKIHTQTSNTDKLALIENSDIIISCAGRDMSELINRDIAVNVEVLVGIGFRYENGKQIQDFDISEDSWNKNIKITNNTMATGTATIAALLSNIILCDKLQMEGY